MSDIKQQIKAVIESYKQKEAIITESSEWNYQYGIEQIGDAILEVLDSAIIEQDNAEPVAKVVSRLEIDEEIGQVTILEAQFFPPMNIADGSLLYAGNPPKDSTEPASKDYHVISDSSDGVIALSRTVAGQLIYLREELAKGDINEAYHALYSIADPTFTSLEPWKRLEEIAAAPTTPKGE